MKNMTFSCNLCGHLSLGRGKYWVILLGTWCLLGRPRPPPPPDNAAGRMRQGVGLLSAGVRAADLPGPAPLYYYMRQIGAIYMQAGSLPNGRLWKDMRVPVINSVLELISAT